MSTKREYAIVFARNAVKHGFRAYLAERGTYGYVTNTEGSRVISFSTDQLGGGVSISGNYAPSREHGSGWQIADGATFEPSKSQIETWLYAGKPAWFRGEFPKHRSEADYRKDYQASSRFEPIEQR